MSEANKNKHHSEETRQKMSEAKKGKKNHFFGKHQSEETKIKCSEASKKYWQERKSKSNP